MILRTLRWFFGLLALIALGCWGASGRFFLQWTLPVSPDGSQTQINIQHGCFRWIWGEQGTMLVGQEDGWEFGRFAHHHYDWWFVFDTSSEVQTIQIPLWLVAIGAAILWLQLLRHEHYVPKRIDAR